MAPLLQLTDVKARYGPVEALHGISLRVGEGEVVAVLGGNGAGKTTTLRAISGLVTTSGEVSFAGDRITGAAPECGGSIEISGLLDHLLVSPIFAP